ncbi:DNA repair protein RAD50 [Elysia marginata]|uniref:DNA repair protein RAD50 n=1 Tax=Elysia marginata TaxID=1093978 RepID=A0AAV4J6C3_9GAST|nr:DNA repair protein RAD50 [Elysia marginata]
MKKAGAGVMLKATEVKTAEMKKPTEGSTMKVTDNLQSEVKDGMLQLASGKYIYGEKSRMQTLDGVLTRRNPEGERQSITSRCADLNREMIGAMGVSKAVLENVIFCHQEDSNWPLSEGKALKEKFDAIFASTRYTKVLDEIKKLKQNQDGDIREGKKELEYLKQHKVKAEQLYAALCLAQPPLRLSSFQPARASPSLPSPSPACLRLGACPAFTSLCYICSPALLSPPPPPPTHTHIMSCAASITGPILVQPKATLSQCSLGPAAILAARHWPYPVPTYC